MSLASQNSHSPGPPDALGPCSQDPDPIARFRTALDRAHETEPDVPTAMTLATADASGRPSARVVLCKHVDERGFVFYTNLHSRKAAELANHPWAALCFHWKSLGQQVRVEGRVFPAEDAEADTYFASRPRPSQIAAWASRQSEPLESREKIEQEVALAERRFSDAEVVRPPFWGGYRLVPERVEFWYHRENRLHDRVLYARDGAGWRIGLLFP